MSEAPVPAALRDLPSVGILLESPAGRALVSLHGRSLVVETLRSLLAEARAAVREGNSAPTTDQVLAHLTEAVQQTTRGTLRPVLNATGIVLHTNLGRAPLGRAVIAAIEEAASGYCNLEFDLATGRRGQRSVHAREMLTLLTGAEEAVVVNNNAASLLLALSALARGKEVIVSRGELIEIGGSFRLPEIMAASGAHMVEVGTTNRTRLSDYAAAIGPDTSLIFKAHRSNFAITGFTEEASVRELAGLAAAHHLPLFYDQGSGLLCRPQGLPLDGEPDVRTLLAEGADIVAFSGDKLLGGPQAGVVVGRQRYVERLAKAPLMRALRVDKLTYAALLAACRGYLGGSEAAAASNPTLAFLSRSQTELRALAERLTQALATRGIAARVVESSGQCGGGTLPGTSLPSWAVELGQDLDAEGIHRALLQQDPPVLAVLREGRLVLDVLALFDEQITPVAEATAKAAR